MTTRELERLLGEPIRKAWVLVLLPDGRLFRRDDDGWFEYPPYPGSPRGDS